MTRHRATVPRRAPDIARITPERLGIAVLVLLLTACPHPARRPPTTATAASAAPASPAAGTGGVTAIVGATIHTEPGRAPIPDGVVTIERGRIVAVGARGTVGVPAHARTIDATGLHLTAGFWNSHVHFTGAGWLDAGAAPADSLDARLRAMLTRHGFTTVVDIGSDPANTARLRERVASREVAGPDILMAGMPIWAHDGVPFYVRDMLAVLGVTPDLVATRDDGVAAVRTRVAGGADVIKLFTGSPVGYGRVTVMPLELVRAITAESRASGRPVLAHPQSLDGIRNAVYGGVNVLAHTAPTAGPLPDELIAAMVSGGVAVIPTLTLWRAGLLQEGESAATAALVQRAGVDQFAGLVRAGVEVLFGTDVGYMAHDETAEELALMQRAGMSPAELLASLTTLPARRFGRGDVAGRIRPGMAADLVLLERDPAEGAAALAAVRTTIRGGLIIHQRDR